MGVEARLVGTHGKRPALNSYNQKARERIACRRSAAEVRLSRRLSKIETQTRRLVGAINHRILISAQVDPHCESVGTSRPRNAVSKDQAIYVIGVELSRSVTGY